MIRASTGPSHDRDTHLLLDGRTRGARARPHRVQRATGRSRPGRRARDATGDNQERADATHRGMCAADEKGLSPRALGFPYEASGRRDAKPKPNAANVAQTLEVFQRVDAGERPADIFHEMEARGLLLIERKFRGVRQRQTMNPKSFHELLRREALIGRRTLPDGTKVLGDAGS